MTNKLHREKEILYACVLLVLVISDLAWAESNDIYQQVTRHVVCVEASSGNPKNSVIGSGFFVAPGLIATTSHQVAKLSNISVHFADGSVLPAKKQLVDTELRLALLSIAQNNNSFLPLRTEPVQTGDKVFTIGCPLGFEHSLSKGIVSHPKRVIDNVWLVQTDLTINPGNSGGPLLNDQGEVVGIVYGFWNESNGINFAVPSPKIKTLLDELLMKSNFVSTREVFDLWGNANHESNATRRISVLQELIAKAPDLPEAHFNLGVAYSETSDLQYALQAFSTAVDKRPDYYQAYTNLGLTLYRLKRFQKAKSVLLRAISINTNYALAYLNLGIVYRFGLADNESAIRAFSQFLELDGQSEDAPQVRQWIADMKKTTQP